MNGGSIASAGTSRGSRSGPRNGAPTGRMAPTRRRAVPGILVASLTHDDSRRPSRVGPRGGPRRAASAGAELRASYGAGRPLPLVGPRDPQGSEGVPVVRDRRRTQSIRRDDGRPLLAP